MTNSSESRAAVLSTVMLSLAIVGELDEATLAAIRASVPGLTHLEVCEDASPQQPVSAIVRAVAYEMGLAVGDIVGPWRAPRLFRARFAVTYVARGHDRPIFSSDRPRPRHRNHTTIINQHRRGCAMRATDPAFRMLTDKLVRRFDQEFAR